MKEIETLRKLPTSGSEAPAVDVVDGAIRAIRQQTEARSSVDPVFTSCSVAFCLMAAVAVPLGLSAWWTCTDPFVSLLRPFTMVMQ